MSVTRPRRKRVAGVIQNSQVNLARRGAQAAAYDLDVPDARLGRARIDDA